MVGWAERGPLWRARRLCLVVLDLFGWLIFLELAAMARYDGHVSAVDHSGLLRAAGAVVLAHLLIAAPLRLYQGRYRLGSLDEAQALTATFLGAGLAMSLGFAILPIPRFIPLSVPLIASVLALVGGLTCRVVLRGIREGAARPKQAEKVLIFGAGAAGLQLLRSMLTDPRSEFLPVALLDDDASKRFRRSSGVRVLGDRRAIGTAARRTGASTLVIAMPSAEAALLLELSALATEHGLKVKALPALADLLAPEVGIRDVRDIDLADILRRRPIDTDIDSIAQYLTGKRVLVTGAGGSIGSELCRQIHRYGPAELMMLDRDESALHAVQLALHGSAQLDLPEVILADIRDGESLQDIFTVRCPEVVFHAAALKHLTILEQYPAEAWKTNVLGTRNVLDAARLVGVSTFVNISTDKAANARSVLGRSKRISERLTADYARVAEGKYLSVRFGNVLGSRGSVLTAFAAQIAGGGPVTVTHPDVTRYFMTVQEAVQLVIQAAALGRDGEALVLDMGTPVRIDDVARQLVSMARHPIDIVYTGLRHGEKLHEDLFSAREAGARPFHPLISHVPVPPINISLLAELSAEILAQTLLSYQAPPAAERREAFSEPAVVEGNLPAAKLISPATRGTAELLDLTGDEVADDELARSSPYSTISRLCEYG